MKTLAEKKRAHEVVWRGEGPGLLLTPTAAMDQYDLAGYRERFENPELMWQAEMRRARPVLDWPYREGLRIDEAMNPLSLFVVVLSSSFQVVTLARALLT